MGRETAIYGVLTGCLIVIRSLNESRNGDSQNNRSTNKQNYNAEIYIQTILMVKLTIQLLGTCTVKIHGSGR